MKTQSHPNVLFIFSDQQRYDTVSCYGEAPGRGLHLTPNIDAPAAGGTRFDSAMTCQPLCGPAWACIQSGMYPTEIGCHLNDLRLPESRKSHPAVYQYKYSNSAKYCIQSDSSEREILRQKSLPCVSTPADFILVFRTLPNRLDCIILLNCYS